MVLMNSEHLTKNQKNQIFHSVKQMYEFHKFYWLPSLNEKVTSWNNTVIPTVCDVFMANFEKIKIHEQFIDNLKNSLLVFNLACETMPSFKAQIEQINQKVILIKNYN